MAVLGQEDRAIGSQAARYWAGLKQLRGKDFFGGPPRHGGKLQPVITLVEIALTLGIALVFGKAFWAVFAPLPIAQSPPAPSAKPAEIVGAANPFRPLTVEAPAVVATPEAVDTSLALTLRGTWHDGEGRGTAVIEAAGSPQKSFKVGDEICCGARLEEVYADRVIISRGGAREALRLPNKRSSSQTAPTMAGPLLSAPGLSAVSVQASQGESGGPELRLFPQNPGAFEAMGLRPGDILVSVNGVPAPLDVAGLNGMLSTLADRETVTISVKRDGVEFPLDVSVADWLGNQVQQ